MVDVTSVMMMCFYRVMLCIRGTSHGPVSARLSVTSRSLSLVMSECSLSGRGQGHVSNFYIVDLENFAIVSRWYRQVIYTTRPCRFVYDTYKTMKATRTHHG